MTTPYQPTSVRQREAHRAYRAAQNANTQDCHAYPEDRSQGCFCVMKPNHKGQHRCSCANTWK